MRQSREDCQPWSDGLVQTIAELTFIIFDTLVEELVNHLIRNGLFLQVLQHELHCGVVGEAAILVFKSKVVGMQVDDERRGPTTILCQYILLVFDYSHC